MFWPTTRNTRASDRWWSPGGDTRCQCVFVHRRQVARGVSDFVFCAHTVPGPRHHLVAADGWWRIDGNGEPSPIPSELPRKVLLAIATESSLLLNTKQLIKVVIEPSQIVYPIFFVLAATYLSTHIFLAETSSHHFLFSFLSLRYLYIS